MRVVHVRRDVPVSLRGREAAIGASFKATSATDMKKGQEKSEWVREESKKDDDGCHRVVWCASVWV